MDWLEFFDLVVPGFVACAEFGFFLFVRPGIRRLPDRYRVEVEQGFLRTFYRVMPILTGLSVILILIYAFRFKENNTANQMVWSAVFCFSAAGASTIWLNQPIEQEISCWNPEQLPGRLEIGRAAAGPSLKGFALRCSYWASSFSAPRSPCDSSPIVPSFSSSSSSVGNRTVCRMDEGLN